jgi:hypothetical protein
VCSNLVNVVTTWASGADLGLDPLDGIDVYDGVMPASADSEHGDRSL